MTQEELAEKMNINTRYVQRLEGQNCPNVKIDTIATIGKLLDAKPEEFFE